MNGTTHQLAGAMTALLVTQNDTSQKPTILHHPIGAMSVGAFMGKVPDIIEPSLGNPNHRQFFHSIAALGLVSAGTYRLYHWEPQDDFENSLRVLLLIGGAAYLSHLALDALTKKALPLIGKV